MLLVPLDLGVESDQTERVGLCDGRDRVERDESLDERVANMECRHDRGAERSILDDLY
jgi:hypothetical protein